MDEYLNYYMNKLDKEAQSHDDEPPLPMTLERAQALIAAHKGGVGMSNELLARARKCVDESYYKHMTQSDWDKREMAEYAHLDIPTGDD